MIESRALLSDKTSLKQLRVPDPASGARMSDRIEGVRLLREKAGADLLVEGWVEGPCAEAADLRGLNTLMFDFTDDAAFVRDLFEFVVEMNLKFGRRADPGGRRHHRRRRRGRFAGGPAACTRSSSCHMRSG